MRAVVALALLVACGDDRAQPEGLPLALTQNVAVIAHQDDDLIFMQPDLPEAIVRGEGVTNVYVTAGNSTKGYEFSEPRYTGLMMAYGQITGDHDWNCGWITVLGHLAQHCRLERENVSLVFLAYPDGGIPGNLPHSLLSMWQGETGMAMTVAPRVTTYTREELIEVVANIVETTHPEVVHTLDLAATHGHDHSDHEIVGAIAGMALMRLDYEPTLIAHRGYDVEAEPPNQTGPVFAASANFLSYYEACATDCGGCGTACTAPDPVHDTWLAAHYAMGFRKRAHGKIVGAEGCLAETGVVACDHAPEWSLVDRQLFTTAGCMTANGTVAPCADDPSTRWLYDDEGHLWSGVPPDFDPAIELNHGRCLTPYGTRACGGDFAYTWQWQPTPMTSPRPFAATGRAVRIGDIDGDGRGDLCTVDHDQLVCALGSGYGTFGAAQPIAPLAVEPESLALAPGKACGRSDAGVVCTTGPFTPAFGEDACVATATSLRIRDDRVCGLANEGVVCATAGSAPTVLSSFPQRTDPLLVSTLDGVDDDDWCTLAASGPMCGLAHESSASTDGTPWAWSFNGLDLPPTDPAYVDLVDIDGEGVSALCGAYGTEIGCARSHGHGFGPRTIVASFPTVPAAVWFGDLDGDGRADVCADLGATISCALL
ncbi:MAG: PIG-L family deacetylase [Kofleriaceae bacterium]